MNNLLSTRSYSSNSLWGAATNSNPIFPAVTVPNQVHLSSIPNISQLIVLQSYSLSI